MPNEYKLEELGKLQDCQLYFDKNFKFYVFLGIQLVDRKQLWAGIVFTNMPSNQKTDDLPNFIQYKIRMDADTVDSTYFVEDRIPRPIPRRRPQIDLKYLYYGFSFLQVNICSVLPTR